MTITHRASPAERAVAELAERALLSELTQHCGRTELSIEDALTLQRLLREHQARGENLTHIIKQRDDVRFELARVAAERDAARELLAHKEKLLGEAIAMLRAGARPRAQHSQVKS